VFTYNMVRFSTAPIAATTSGTLAQQYGIDQLEIEIVTFESEDDTEYRYNQRHRTTQTYYTNLNMQATDTFRNPMLQFVYANENKSTQTHITDPCQSLPIETNVKPFRGPEYFFDQVIPPTPTPTASTAVRPEVHLQSVFIEQAIKYDKNQRHCQTQTYYTNLSMQATVAFRNPGLHSKRNKSTQTGITDRYRPLTRLTKVNFLWSPSYGYDQGMSTTTTANTTVRKMVYLTFMLILFR